MIPRQSWVKQRQLGSMRSIDDGHVLLTRAIPTFDGSPDRPPLSICFGRYRQSAMAKALQLQFSNRSYSHSVTCGSIVTRPSTPRRHRQSRHFADETVYRSVRRIWLEARAGIEPACADLQSAASPLRHRASCQFAALADEWAGCWTDRASDGLCPACQGFANAGSGIRRWALAKAGGPAMRGAAGARAVLALQYSIASARASRKEGHFPGIGQR